MLSKGFLRTCGALLTQDTDASAAEVEQLLLCLKQHLQQVDTYSEIVV